MDPFAIILGIFLIGLFVMVGMMIFAPRFRNRMFDNQMRMAKSMLEDNKDTFKELSKTTIEFKKEILEENEEALKDLAAKEADIESVGLEKKAAAVKKGLTDTKKCKYCDATIEADSIFCKECGKKQ